MGRQVTIDSEVLAAAATALYATGAMAEASKIRIALAMACGPDGKLVKLTVNGKAIRLPSSKYAVTIDLALALGTVAVEDWLLITPAEQAALQKALGVPEPDYKHGLCCACAHHDGRRCSYEAQCKWMAIEGDSDMWKPKPPQTVHNCATCAKCNRLCGVSQAMGEIGRCSQWETAP